MGGLIGNRLIGLLANRLSLGRKLFAALIIVVAVYIALRARHII